MATPRILFPSSSSSSSPMLLVNPSIGVGVGVGSSPLMVGYLTSSTRSKLVTMCCSNINNHVNNIHTCSCKNKNKNKNKIFEDGSAGIVCYRDENGEITCEGYDEGPRFHHNLSTFHYNNTPTPTTTTYRDVEIIQQLLQRCWLQVAEDEDEDEDEDDGEN